MNYEIFYDPIAHVFIDDFFTDEEYAIIFNSIKRIENKMTAGLVLQHHGIGKLTYKHDPIKKNLNFWPYQNPSEDSKNIIDIIESKVWSSEMRKLYVSVKDSNFQYFHFTDQSTILVSKYGKDCYYDWHFDTCGTVTLNMMMSQEEVIGGNFIIKNILGEIKEIKYKNNRCILFPSLCSHKVTEVENDCSRYSIQYFSSKRQENGVKYE